MTVVDEIKDRLDIVEVISSYVPLQKAGRNFKALCPFHSEKTASFVVFPESQHWRCFGACSEGGDVFTFVMKQEGWDFRTALTELAIRAGVELRPRTPAQDAADQERARLLEALASASVFFHHCLRDSPEAAPAREYMQRRGLAQETIEQFQLGFSPSGWDTTHKHLAELTFSTKELIESGLLVQRDDSGSSYDRFRERLMIPIRDAKGQVIGFGARTLDPAGAPKYINSPQSPIFDKSRTLFGFDRARKSIRRLDEAVIVEGYMDVMQAHQAGYENVVAQMGTALTEAQLQTLQNTASRLILALDPDAAGVQATFRGLEVARATLDPEWRPVFDPRGLVGFEARLGIEIRVLRLPAGNDPDDVIRKDPAQWAALVDGALPVVDFYLEMLLKDLDLTDTKAKARVVDTLVPVLRAVANPVEQDDYVQKIARALRVDARAISSQLRSPQRSPDRYTRRDHARATDPTASQQPADLEGHCISLLLARPYLLDQVGQMLVERDLATLRGSDFGNTSYRVAFETLCTVLASGSVAPVEDLWQELSEDAVDRINRVEMKDYSLISEERLVRDAVRTVLRMRLDRLRKEWLELEMLLVESQEAGDARAAQYDTAQPAFRRELLLTQKAMARLSIG